MPRCEFINGIYWIKIKRCSDGDKAIKKHAIAITQIHEKREEKGEEKSGKAKEDRLDGRSEARVGLCGLSRVAHLPLLTAPVGHRGRLVGVVLESLPEDVAVVGDGDVREERVLLQRAHRVRVRLHVRTRRHSFSEQRHTLNPHVSTESFKRLPPTDKYTLFKQYGVWRAKSLKIYSTEIINKFLFDTCQHIYMVANYHCCER